MNIWLDDVVGPFHKLWEEKKQWTWVHSVKECISTLEDNWMEIEAISFDYNLEDGKGVDVCKWIEDKVVQEYSGGSKIPPFLKNMEVAYHTGDFEGAQEMRLCFSRILVWLSANNGT
jgi:hypothetical protein